MDRIALITDPGHPGLRADDVALPAAFAARGAEATPVPWGASIGADEFDAAVVRTPWDYFLRPAAFLAWVEDLPVEILNPAPIVRWNHDKRYLFELAERGVAELPETALLAPDERPARLDAELDRIGADKAVLKPAVSGGAHRTRVVGRGEAVEWTGADEGVFLVQEHVGAVLTRGEWSLMFFGGRYSHSVRKTAKRGDFRVQSEHGGEVLVEDAPAALVDAAARVLQGVPTDATLPYARVDLVEADDGRALLMELELIEPELFLRSDPDAPARLVDSVLAQVRSRS
ncbi:MAG: hypothetical protein AAF726_22000 [Planctomycetota bacterium]